MATAPRPGSRAEAEAARQFIRIRIKDTTLDLMPDITMDERFVVRAATGLPIEAFLPADKQDGFGMDSLFVLWWIAQRQNGKPNLPYKQAQAEWPEVTAGIQDEGDIDFILVDLDDESAEDDSPESSGPGSASPGPTSPTSSASVPGKSVA